MFSALVKDFAFNTEHVFARAVPFEEAGFTVFGEAMLRTFGPALRTTDISLDQGDRLYNYRLAFRMFNGSAEVILTSAGATAAFRDARNKAGLQTIGTCVIAIESLLDRFSTQLRHALFAAHATFEKEEEYDSYMGRVADKKRGYTAGGVTLHCPAHTIDGQIRFSTDKSQAFEQALFVACQLTTPERFSKEILAKFEARFAEISEDLSLNFKLPE